jgi:predicted lipoprotein with Yx(FWY)xxD motif
VSRARAPPRRYRHGGHWEEEVAMRAMIRSRFVGASLAMAVLTLAGLARADAGAVKVAKSEKVGSYLTDDKGMTLYVFKKDAPGKSACAGPCVAAWPIYYREKIEPTEGVSAGDFGTIDREDGKKQTTYKGLPLYYFAQDRKPGQMEGHGFKDLWAAAAP